MHNLLSVFFIIFTFFLTGCTATQFGVPEEQWLQMNDEQKQLAISGYNQRQLLAEQRRLERAKADALIQQQQKALQEKKEQRQQARINRIRNGAGDLGDLIRVSILSCQAKLHNKYRQINPVSIKLADGEHREIKINSVTHKDRSYSASLPVKYNEGLVTISGQSSGKKSIKLAYEQSWLKGHRYHKLSAKGAVKLKECEIAISVIPSSSFSIRSRYYD
ncbi:MAG: hypothetical protein GQ546_14975 [Gammaproteobacteria bacterium]|nr:hypothetical protein [Gammaproteobacteria bacterium]